MIRFFRVFFLLLVIFVCSYAAEDQFAGVTPELQKFINPYMERAKATFPAVKQKYIAGDYVRENRSMYVQIDVKAKDGTKEMAFIKVIKCVGSHFQGILSNTMYYVKEYKNGDTLSFSENQIVNWVVVDAEGKEEGNYVGKAIDAYLSQKVGVFFEVVYRKGQFSVSYQDAKDRKQNSVDGIIPEKVIAQIAERLKAGFEKKKREGTTFEEGKPFFSYGIYDCHTGEIEP